MNSLDPRVKRLPSIDTTGNFQPKAPLDQLGTYEVFVQPKDGKPFQHEGIILAPDLEMAFILAKESLTRRFQCVSLFVADTRNVMVSAVTEGDASAYDTIESGAPAEGRRQQHEVVHLPKRGKQHVHVGSVEAGSVEEAFNEAKKKFGTVKVYNVWVIPSGKIRFTLLE